MPGLTPSDGGVHRILRTMAMQRAARLVTFHSHDLVQVLIEGDDRDPQAVTLDARCDAGELREFVLESVSEHDARLLSQVGACLAGRNPQHPFSLLTRVRSDGLDMACVRDRLFFIRADSRHSRAEGLARE